ncbi:Uncharacterized protein Fot_11090 [Forsythia ovata]|uniref:Uncharacterized protein n=1 Tax=Forsythia ovata TaxID=205694 RepID=A0ABD1WMG1_9LAMI
MREFEAKINEKDSHISSLNSQVSEKKRGRTDDPPVEASDIRADPLIEDAHPTSSPANAKQAVVSNLKYFDAIGADRASFPLEDVEISGQRMVHLYLSKGRVEDDID